MTGHRWRSARHTGVVKPSSDTSSTQPTATLADLLAAGDVVVLTGAGISTGSGIPDYRGITGRTRTAPPMQWDAFRDDPAQRQRYWARSIVGHRRFAGITPNAAHRAVAELQGNGHITAVLTQNVDGLHESAGTTDVIRLHGNLVDVICMTCERRRPRIELQAELDDANPGFSEVIAPQLADGDAAVEDRLVADFRIVTCICGGEWRPDVVFFGEFVPRERMERARAAAENAATLLVLGSSLHVGTGYLLVRHAIRHGANVAVVNLGPTRADHLVDVRVHGDVTDVLPPIAASLRPETNAT